uniref:hypothetical protein n=1 Tax=Mariniphaga sediminis TaxID=1628158 RepID=UPI00356A2774
AFGSTRVMATCGHGAQAVALASVLCVKNEINTKEILLPQYLPELQNQLNLTGQSIPGKAIDYNQLSVEKPTIKVSSTYELSEMSFDGGWTGLKNGFAQLLPFTAHQKYSFKILIKAKKQSIIIIQLRKSSKLGNYTPDVELESIEIPVSTGEQFLNFSFESTFETEQYAFLTILSNDDVKVKTSEQRLTGTLSLFQKKNIAVSNYGSQLPPTGIGVDSFEFWTPKRRPEGKNLAFHVTPAIKLFDQDNICNGYVRPYLKSNAWAASLKDNSPEILLSWNTTQKINKIRLFFDTDYDHPMESVQMGHPEDIIPFCIQNYSIYDKEDKLLYEKKGNYQTINDAEFESVIECTELKIRLEHPSKDVPAALFEIICLNDNPN